MTDSPHSGASTTDSTESGAKGTVIVAYGSHGVVQQDQGTVVECHFRRGVGRPVCGDRVTLSRQDRDRWAVDAVASRRSEFYRTSERGRAVLIAANLDQVAVVIAPRPAPTEEILDRYLVAVHALGLRPLIVVNKAELPLAAERGPLSRLDYYRSLGYALVHTSCKEAPGTEALSAQLTGQRSILVGQSGVGKSALARKLLNQAGQHVEIATGDLSEQTGKGTHTTTTTRLYSLDGDTELIDSPGVWEYGVWQLDRDTVRRGFIDIDLLAAGCRFHNCRHQAEPGCAVKAAVAADELPRARYQAFQRLFDNATP